MIVGYTNKRLIYDWFSTHNMLTSHHWTARNNFGTVPWTNNACQYWTGQALDPRAHRGIFHRRARALQVICKVFRELVHKTVQETKHVRIHPRGYFKPIPKAVRKEVGHITTTAWYLEGWVTRSSELWRTFHVLHFTGDVCLENLELKDHIFVCYYYLSRVQLWML